MYRARFLISWKLNEQALRHTNYVNIFMNREKSDKKTFCFWSYFTFEKCISIMVGVITLTYLIFILFYLLVHINKVILNSKNTIRFNWANSVLLHDQPSIFFWRLVNKLFLTFFMSLPTLDPTPNSKFSTPPSAHPMMTSHSGKCPWDLEKFRDLV